MVNIKYQNNTGSLAQGNLYPSSQNSTSQHRQIPDFAQHSDANVGQRLDPNARNWSYNNRQSTKINHSGQRVHTYLHNEQQSNRRPSHNRKFQTPNRLNRLNRLNPSPTNQGHQPRGYYGEGLDPALAHQQTDPLNQLRQQRLHQHDGHRGPKGKQPSNRRQHKMGTQTQPGFSADDPFMFRKLEQESVARSRERRNRVPSESKGMEWQRHSPHNINQNPKRAPSGSHVTEMYLIE